MYERRVHIQREYIMKTLNTVTTRTTTRAAKAVLKTNKISVSEYKDIRRGLNSENLQLEVEVDPITEAELLAKKKFGVVRSFIVGSGAYPYIKEELNAYCNWILTTLEDSNGSLISSLGGSHVGSFYGVKSYLNLWNSTGSILGLESLALARKAEQKGLSINYLADFLGEEVINLSETEWDFYEQMTAFYKKVNDPDGNHYSDVNGHVWRKWKLSGWSLDENKVASDFDLGSQYGYDITRGRTYENPWSFLEVNSEVVSSLPRKHYNYNFSVSENINSGFYDLYEESLAELGQKVSSELMKDGRFREVQKASDVLGIALNAYGYDLNEGMDVSSVKRTASVSRLLVLLRNGFKPSVKMKVLNNLNYTSEEKASLLILSKILGKEVVNLKKFYLYSEHIPKNIVDITPVPVKFQRWVSTQTLAVNWVLEEGLDIDWNLKLSGKQNIIAALAVKYNVDEDTAEIIYTTPGIIESIEFAGKNPQVCGEGVLPNVKLSYEGYTMSRLEKKDITNLYIGELTSCCQKLGGFGESVCTEGWNDPYSSNYVFKKGEDILAHVWVWKATDGSLILDSIEGRSHADSRVVYELLMDFKESLDCDVLLGTSSYGLTSDILKFFTEEFPEAISENTKIPTSITEYSYLDATQGSLGYLL